MALNIGELYAVLSSKDGQFKASMNNAVKQMKTVSESAQAMGRSLSLKVTAPLMIMGGMAVRQGYKFQAALELTNTMMKLSGEQVKIFREQVLRLSSTWGKAADDIAGAGYKISSVLHTNALDTVKILEATTLAARAGKLSVVEATEAVVNSMSIYDMAADKAMQVTDTLAATVREGNANWQDVAMQIPRVSGTAYALGVSLEEVGGSFAYMSGKAGSSAVAATGLVNLYMALLKPTPAMEVALESIADKLGIVGKKTATSIIQQKGLGVAMQELGRYIGDDTKKLTDMIPGIRGIAAATAIFRNDTDKFQQSLRGVIKSLGEAKLQMEAGEGPAERLEHAWTRIKNSLIRAFYVMEPVIISLMGYVVKTAEWFGNLSASGKTLLIGVLALAAAIGPLIIAMGSLIFTGGQLWPVLVLIAVKAWAATVALLALGAVPVLIGITAIVIGLNSIKNSLMGIYDAAAETKEILKTLPDATGEYTKSGFWHGMAEFVKAQTGWMTLGARSWEDFDKGAVFDSGLSDLDKAMLAQRKQEEDAKKAKETPFYFPFERAAMQRAEAMATAQKQTQDAIAGFQTLWKGIKSIKNTTVEWAREMERIASATRVLEEAIGDATPKLKWTDLWDKAKSAAIEIKTNLVEAWNNKAMIGVFEGAEEKVKSIKLMMAGLALEGSADAARIIMASRARAGGFTTDVKGASGTSSTQKPAPTTPPGPSPGERAEERAVQFAMKEDLAAIRIGIANMNQFFRN